MTIGLVQPMAITHSADRDHPRHVALLRSGEQDGGSGSMLLAVAGVSLTGVGGQAIWRSAPLAHAGAF